MDRTISKHMEPPWELKWQYHLPIFSWLKLKQLWYNKARPCQKYGDDILTISSPSGTVIKKDVDQFIEQANKFHPTIKFTAEISENEITFLDTVVFKWERLKNESILDIKTHYKPTETFQYTHFNSCHPPGVKNGFIKDEATRLLKTNSSKTTFEESLVKFKQRLRWRGYPKTVIGRSLSGVNFAAGPSALTQKKKANERILPFVTTYTTQQWTTSNRHWWNNGVSYKISLCWKLFIWNLR